MNYKMCWATIFSSGSEELNHEKIFPCRLQSLIKDVSIWCLLFIYYFEARVSWSRGDQRRYSIYHAERFCELSGYWPLCRHLSSVGQAKAENLQQGTYRCFLLKYRLIFLWVLKVFDEPSGELNTELRVKVFIYYYVPSFEIQAGIFWSLESSWRAFNAAIFTVVYKWHGKTLIFLIHPEF